VKLGGHILGVCCLGEGAFCSSKQALPLSSFTLAAAVTGVEESKFGLKIRKPGWPASLLKG